MLKLLKSGFTKQKNPKHKRPTIKKLNDHENLGVNGGWRLSGKIVTHLRM